MIPTESRTDSNWYANRFDQFIELTQMSHSFLFRESAVLNLNSRQKYWAHDVIVTENARSTTEITAEHSLIRF